MRETHCYQILLLITGLLGKRLSTYTTSEGVVTLVKGPDGQAYEISIKPAARSTFEPFKVLTQKHQRGLVHGG